MWFEFRVLLSAYSFSSSHKFMAIVRGWIVIPCSAKIFAASSREVSNLSNARLDNIALILGFLKRVERDAPKF